MCACVQMLSLVQVFSMCMHLCLVRELWLLVGEGAVELLAAFISSLECLIACG